MDTKMNFAKAYEMVITANGSLRSAPAADRGAHEPWLAAGIYRAVSRTADLIDRLASRKLTRS